MIDTLNNQMLDGHKSEGNFHIAHSDAHSGVSMAQLLRAGEFKVTDGMDDNWSDDPLLADEMVAKHNLSGSTWRKYSWLGLVVVVLALLFGALWMVEAKPAKPIAINADNLDAYEQQALAEQLAKFGVVQAFETDLQAVYTALDELSWVDSANITRDWERGLVVSVTPKQPVASFGSERMLDVKGEVFYPANPNTLSDKSMAMLHSDDEHAHLVMRQMYQVNEWFEPLGLMASDVILTPRQTWLIRFDNGMRVTVDHEGTDQKLYALSQNLSNPALRDKIDSIDAVDLRYKNGFTLAWKEALIHPVHTQAENPASAERKISSNKQN